MPENEEVAPVPTAEAQQDVAQTSDAKAEATSTAKASDELSEDDLEAVAGGGPSYNSVPGYNKGPKGSPGYILGLPIRPGS
jgi:hypothetical protein